MKIPGLLNRFEREIKDYSKLNGKKFKGKPKILKDNSTWFGGVDFSNSKYCNWIKKEDYDDYGSGIIYKNCF